MLVLAAFASSCEKTDEPTEETVTVNITASLLGMENSRSEENVIEGVVPDILHYAVYKANESKIGSRTNVIGSVSTKNTAGDFTLDLRLVKNQRYMIVFWAQELKDSSCDPYNRIYDENYHFVVQVDYTKKLTDAYCGQSEIFYATAGTAVNVTLTRPFAQLNIKGEEGEGNELVDKVNLTVSKCAKEINLVTMVTMSFEEVNMVVNSSQGTDNIISQLILPTGEDVTIGVELLKEGTPILSASIPHCPLNANYRTNIILPISANVVNQGEN